MSFTNRPETDDAPPPSYNEAIKDTLVVEESTEPQSPPLPQRRPTQRRPPPEDIPTTQSPPQPSTSTSNNYLHVPPPPHRPPEHRSLSRTSISSRHSHESPNNAELYTNNPNLPFNYTRGYYCKKCKNSGYKSKNEICRPCWDFFYLKDHAYNPNEQNLPFKYPKRFYCTKCGNTGYKFKNGFTCQNCWSQFGPRNTYSYVNSNFQPSFFGSTTFVPAPGTSNGMPARRVPPGSPELGGLLCGNCRGQGMVHFLFDSDLCPVCGGLGRVFTQANPPAGSAPPPPPPRPYNQYNYGGPPPPPPHPQQQQQQYQGSYGGPPQQQWGGYQYDYNSGTKN